jgi:cell wall-associated NlpC family hydrolase
LVVGIAVPAGLMNSSAGADSVASLQQRANALAAEIQGDYAKLQVLDEGYNQAHQRVQQLQRSVDAATKAIGRAERQLSTDKAHLRTVAIDAYVTGGSSPGLSMLLSSSSKQLPMQQAYLSAASGDLSAAEALVETASHDLAGHRAALLRDQQQAVAVQRKIATERSLAQQITAQLESELSTVKGDLAQAVAAAERQKALQELAAAQAAALAQQQRVTQPSPPAPPPPPPVVGGGSGGAAVRAAESQLGVPYVWGGATPGVGFDCSGLTMWAWGQAGVSLAHGATDQYYEIAHVSMSALQPGDLIFYGSSSYLYHVVMYVGSGPYGSDTVIQAQNTGTNVMFTPMPGGAYGAGRP